MHVGIIMDGNGRWAAARGLARSAGHRAGADRLPPLVAAAPGAGISILTLYVFSSGNWGRPASETAALMDLLTERLGGDLTRLGLEGVRVSAIGRRDRLPGSVRTALARLEAGSCHGTRLWLRLAVDYSAREEILRAAARVAREGPLTPERFTACLAGSPGPGDGAPDVDLLIRTGGERRLSDFLLWESAWAELYFTDRPWPEFDAEALAEAVADYHRRVRRFGRLSAEPHVTV